MKPLKLSIAAFCAIVFCSCSPQGLDHLFFMCTNSGDIQKNSFEYVLDGPAEKTILTVAADVTSSDYISTTDAVSGGNIPANTKVRILARSYVLGAKKHATLKRDYIVELPNGERCIASFDKQGDAYVDSVYPRRTQLPLYSRYYGRIEAVKATEIESLIGKSLAEVERLICPANQILVKGRVKEAMFSNVSSLLDSTAYIGPLVLRLEDDIVTANISKVIKFEPNDSFLSKIAGVYAKATSAITPFWFDLPAWKKHTVFARWGVPDQFTRMIVSNVIFAILFLVFCFFVAPKLALETFIHIKPLGNGVVQTLAYFIYIVLGVLACIYIWTPFSLIWFVFVSIFSIGNIQINLRFSRCPHCHTIGRVRYLDDTFLGTTARERDHKYQVKTGESTHMEGNTKVHTIHVKDVVDRWRTTTKHYRENFYCDACNQKISYSRTEEDAKIVSSK